MAKSELNTASETLDQNLIRNFAIIAHIDHGKSTLADRLIEICGGVLEREMQDQLLDNMDIERERGITVKAQTVRLRYHAVDGLVYTLNLIDTPGHVDFNYEVSRSLAACDGALLIVDASQGIEAQTLVNAFLAVDAGLEILPVLNKIDLPAADVDNTLLQIKDIVGLPIDNARSVSAKSGIGIRELLEDIVKKLPPPECKSTKDTLKALLIDSWYDTYLGVVVLVRIMSGMISRGDKILMMKSKAVYTVEKIGIFAPRKIFFEKLKAGDIGFFTASIRNVGDTNIGDTITSDKNPATKPLPGFKKSQPVVFCGIYPSDSNEYLALKEAMAKLRLNDSSFSFEVDRSSALGFGFRCGFLGLLHLEIISERIRREFNLTIITTSPSVIYDIEMNNGKFIKLANPADMPEKNKIKQIYEPWIKATILTPKEYLGDIITLCTEKRGKQITIEYTGQRAIVTYELPLNEVVFDFHDRLKSLSKGYASFDYQFSETKAADLVKLSILINGEIIDALANIVHNSNAYKRGKIVCENLKELIPKHLFKIPIQASIGAKIIARETISALRKDVTAKCYGGDITRKRKLLDRQKKGKKQMKQFGRVNIPHDVFVKILKIQN